MTSAPVAAPQQPSQPATLWDDHQAVQNRKRAYRASLLEDGRLAILADYLERRSRRPHNAEPAYARALKAVALAPTITICRLLLRGERVHWKLLDAKGAERYGLRDGCRRRDGRHALEDFNDVAAPL